MNIWQSFNQYELEQRKIQLAKQQQAAEEQQHNEEQRLIQMQQQAKQLRTAEQQRREEQVAISLKPQQKEQQPKKSPLETAFLEAWLEAHPEIKLVPQHSIGKYRVDFAHLETMTIIELDGRKYHSEEDKLVRDYQRQRYIESLDWHFIRFRGREIHGNVESCVQIVWERIQARMAR